MGTRIGHILGFEIRVQIGWVVILAIIGYLAVSELNLAQPTIDSTVALAIGGLVAIGFFLSSTVHDLAHAIVARRRGLAISSISVTFFGGATPLEPVAPKASDDLVIAVAGPVASIAVGVVLAAIAAGADAIGGPIFETAAESLAILVALNFILGVVNLLPAYPLDGGRVVRALGWRRGGSIDAGWRTAARAGRLTGFATIAFGVVALASGPVTSGSMIILSGWFLVLSARRIGDREKVNRIIGGLHVSDAMETSPVSVGPTLTVDTLASQLLDGESTMTAVPVVNDGDVIGVLGIRDIQRLQQRRWATTRVEEVMAKPPRLIFLSARDSLVTAIERLQRAGLDGLPVVDGTSLVGILTRRSVGQLLHERGLLTREGRTVA